MPVMNAFFLSFYTELELASLNYFGWTQWCYVFPTELWFSKRCILSYANVQQGDHLGPFSLVQVDLFDQIPSIPEIMLSAVFG